MKQKLKNIFGSKEAKTAEDGKDTERSSADDAALNSPTKQQSDESDSDEGEDVPSKPVSANFNLEKFFSEKKIERRWRVQAQSSVAGIEQGWAMTLYPKGKDVKGSVSVFFSFEDEGRFANGWYLDVKVRFVIVNLKDAAQSITKEQQFRFCEKDKTHGWEDFCNADLIFKDKDKVYRDGDDVKFVFSVDIVREKGCSGSFRAGYAHDSFQATGFCGLKNQGATCYLNSLLQALYWVAPFRASVYKLPTTEDVPDKSIPLALQRLFYRLQFTNAPVSTTELTNSFGWGTRDVFTQHDVQELNRVLQDKIEEKMKGTSEEGTVARLFRGKMVSYIKCKNVEYESKREEEFYDVSMDVMGCKDVYASFDKFTQPELLTGDNKYQAEGFGLQDAEKGFRFIQFPAVLHLQLKRFDFDYTSMRNYKIHSRYEFPRELDLSKYVDANSPYRGDPAVYVLQGVLVHSGTATAGHYYAYFRPSKKKAWFKFNDTRVTKATSEEAIEGNFGTEPVSNSKNQTVAAGGASVFSGAMSSLGAGLRTGMGLGGGTLGGKDSFTSAYMLQYVRKDHFEACVSRVPEEAIPPHIAQRFQDEERERERRRLEKQDAHLYLFVKVFDDADLAAHAHFDLMDFERVRPDRVFRVLKASSVRDLKEKHLAKAFGVDDPDKLRLRQFTRRKNQTIRASKVVDNEAEELAKMQNKENIDSLRFLVEVSPRASAPFFEPVSDSECQVFFKFYDPLARRLQFVTRLNMQRNETPLSVEPRLRQLVNLPADAPLFYWEEVRWDTMRIDPIDPTKVLSELELGNGDIIVFQTIAPGHVASEAQQEQQLGQNQLTQSGRAVGAMELEIPWAKQYFVFLQESISVRFKRVADFEQDPGFSVMCIKSNTYNEVQDLVAKHLPRDVCPNPRQIEFTGHSTYSNRPLYNGEIPYEPSMTLVKMLQRSMYSSALADTIYYAVQPFTLDEMKQKLAVSLRVSDLKQAVLYSGKVVVDKTATVEQLISEARKLCKPPVPEEQALRVLGVSFHKVHSVLQNHETVANIARSQLDLSVEFVAADETPDKPGKLVPCVHGEFEYFIHPYGTPFLLWINKKETVGSVRARLATRLSLTPEEVSKWKIGVVEGGFSTGLKWAADQDVLDPEKWSASSYLALVHANRKKAESSNYWGGGKQGGVVIREADDVKK